MYTKKKGLAALIAAVTGLSSLAVGTVSAAPAAAENEEAVKILSLGDSITDGYWTSGAYRKYMYHDLEQMGYNIDMVGPKGGNSNTFTYNGQSVSYDDNNAGYSGYAIQEMTTKEHRSGILETIQGTWYNGQNMIAAYQPDIVLLQKHLCNKATLKKRNAVAADLNADDAITILDAVLLKRKLL